MEHKTLRLGSDLIVTAIELLPCPFCGGRNIDPSGLTGTMCQSAACLDCYAAGPQVDYSNAAPGSVDVDKLCVERWNQRASE